MKIARRLFFVAITVSAMFGEGTSQDPTAFVAYVVNADLKSWSAIPLAFTPIEIILVVSALLWLLADVRERRRNPFRAGTFFMPVIFFVVALAVGMVWGLVRGGDNLTYALFEVRALAVCMFAYVLVGMFIHNDRDLDSVVWCCQIAATYLALEDLYRFYVVLHGTILNDLVYTHDDEVVLALGLILCVALLAFGGTRRQRLWAVLLAPTIVWCMLVMDRRAVFGVVGVGLFLLVVVMLRLRPKLFWTVVPPLVLVVGAYLGIFWTNNGTLGQPAHAIRSLISPDPRDAASNAYRDTERLDILTNIAASRYLGLGFGQQYTFYLPLADLSWWQFWHYEAHNSDLWVWMDGGIPAFFTLWWVLGSGMYWGARELARRREDWSLRETLPRRLRQRRARQDHLPCARRRRNSDQIPSADVPRTPLAAGSRKSAVGAALGQASGATALLTASLALIGMHVTYSYVELGMVSGRDMLLLGVALGVLGRTYNLHPTPRAAQRVRHADRGLAATEREAPRAGAPVR
jgi:hypothetical protein